MRSQNIRQKENSHATGDHAPESPAEMAARVHQVISVIADAVLKLAYERFGPDLGKLEEKKQKSTPTTLSFPFSIRYNISRGKTHET